MKLLFVLTIVLAAMSFSAITAFAQTQLIFVETSQKVYEEGETIVVSGNVTSIIGGEQVSITLFHEGTLVDIAQVPVAQDGTYNTIFKAEGPLWNKDGIYYVKALYGKTTIETNFQFFSKQAIIETTDIFDVDAGSYGTFDVAYKITGGTVKDMRVDSTIFALIVIIETESDGSITLDLPREAIDAKKAGDLDDDFIILIDGQEVSYKEPTKDSEFRTITIDFEEQDQDIEIIGTFVIPEFGTIAMIILVVGIISMILFSSKFKFPITKTY